MGLVLPIIIGLFLRLICIDKAEGLWNDEYVSWFISSKPMFDGFVQGITSQCHMPLYYLYLKFYMTLFGNSDLALRLSSVLTGVLSIAVMYFCGLEKDKKTAVMCAVITALSAFLIYYSQEVRLYSLLFLISSLTLLSTLKLIKSPSLNHIIFAVISNFLIIFTHTIGFVFVFFNIVFVSINLYKTHKKAMINLWVSVLILGLLTLPLIVNVFTTNTFSQWWGSFSASKLGFLITDYFSPMLTNLTNSPEHFFYNFTWGFLIFALIPSLTALIWLAKSLTNRENTGLFAVAIFTVTVLVAASLSGRLVFLTKYAIEIYPILILLVSIGAMSFKNSFFKYFLITLFCTLQIVYIPISPVSAPKIKRSEGHKIPADLLKNASLNKGDYIIIEYYPQDRFGKYIDLSDYNVTAIDKGTFTEYLTPQTDYNDAYKNGKDIYKNIFTKEENPYFNGKIDDIINRMHKGQNIAIVMLNSTAFYSVEEIKNIASDETLYNDTPLLFLVFSYVKNQTFDVLSKHLSIVRFEKKGSWSVIKFTKLNNDT